MDLKSNEFKKMLFQSCFVHVSQMYIFFILQEINKVLDFKPSDFKGVNHYEFLTEFRNSNLH